MSHMEDRNYYGDGRVRARDRHSLIKQVDQSKMLGTITLIGDDGDTEEEFEVKVRYEVCPTCDGKGRHVNPSVDAGGLSADDFAEDPGFMDEYMGGVYDVQCYECHGERVVAVLDRDRIEPAILARINDQEQSRREYERERDAERRFGC